MRTDSVQPRFYTREELKYEAKSAAVSAGLSAGVTLLVNKGQNPSLAGRVGLLAGAISLTLGFINKICSNKKIKKDENLMLEQKMVAGRMESHQG